jgi:hypothetical protein
MRLCVLYTRLAMRSCVSCTKAGRAFVRFVLIVLEFVRSTTTRLASGFG